MFGLNPRELQKQLKQLKRMGIKVDQLQNVQRVVIELQDRRVIVEEPEVFVMEFGGQKLFYVAGNVKEEIGVKQAEERTETVVSKISEEDVKFVAEYLNISLEEARKLLEEAKGDVALAIEIGQTRKR
jgi:nascent polypeptide-associated complex subunit alpha